MVDRLIAWAIANRATVVLLVVGLVGGGLLALRSLPVDAFPDLTDVQVTVLADVPGLAPTEVERFVAYPLEVAMNGLPRVQKIRSVSKYAFASITIVFDEGTDLQFARNLVNQRMQAAREGLPASAKVELGPLSGANSEIYMYTVTGAGRELMELRTIHDRIVRPQLRSVRGVTEVNGWGGFVRQAQVVVRPDQLTRYRLTLHDVVEALAGNNALTAGGYLEHRDEQLILRGLGQVTMLDDLRHTVIRATSAGVPILVGDVAEVRVGAELRQGAVSRDGEGEVVSGIVMMLRGENAREVVARVRQQVATINQSLPTGVKVEPYYDATELVEGTVRTVRTNLLEGGLLVLAVLLVFLGDLRAALLVAATIPLSLLFAFIGMRWLGLSANLMSLGAIDFGMIVDGSVVMSEQFVRRLHGRGDLDAAGTRGVLKEAAHDVGRPVAFGVLIILLVYLPILTLQGLEGRMFRPMALTVGFALFGSLLIALAVVPAVATWLFRRGAREAEWSVRLAARLDSAYARLLKVVLPHPRRTMAVALAGLVGGALLVPKLGTEFVPQLDEGALLVDAVRDPAVSLTTSMAMQADVERAVLRSPEVTHVLSRVGRPTIGSDPMGVNKADVFIGLKPRDAWRPGLSREMLEAEIAGNLDQRAPGIAYAITQPMQMRLDELISGVRADLAVKVFGDDPQQNRRVAERVADVVRRVPGATQVRVEATEGQGYLNVRLDRTQLARFGIPVREVQEALGAAVGGEPVSHLLEGSYTVDVMVQYPAELRASPEEIGRITVPSSAGARIPIAQLADIRIQPGPVQVRRERAQRFVQVQANVTSRDLGGFAAGVQEAVARDVRLPPGVFVAYGGEFENQARAMQRLRIVVPVSLALIATLLYVSIQSAPLAGLILVNLPFAAIGGVVALWLRGLHLSVSSLIGFIALFGVAVLNGLVLLTTVQRRRAQGAGPRDAAEAGARERLRPVLMTALVASLGFVPVALSEGRGAEVQRPLATVVIGGLLTSTLLTLLVLPTVYAWVEEWRVRRGRR